jgi:hypothetical protein
VPAAMSAEPRAAMSKAMQISDRFVLRQCPGQEGGILHPTLSLAHTERPYTAQQRLTPHIPRPGCRRRSAALPKNLANSTRSGHVTWSKLLTLFHQGQSPAPVLLQFHVPLSTSGGQSRLPPTRSSQVSERFS